MPSGMDLFSLWFMTLQERLNYIKMYVTIYTSLHACCYFKTKYKLSVCSGLVMLVHSCELRAPVWPWKCWGTFTSAAAFSVGAVCDHHWPGVFLSGIAGNIPTICTSRRLNVLLAGWVVEDQINQVEDVEAAWWKSGCICIKTKILNQLKNHFCTSQTVSRSAVS